MVVRMHRFLRTEFTTEQLNRTIGDNLVRVHVALCATSSLEHNKREMIDQLAGNDLFFHSLSEFWGQRRNGTYVVGCLLDGFSNLGVQPISHVHSCCRLLEDTESLDQRWR